MVGRSGGRSAAPTRAARYARRMTSLADVLAVVQELWPASGAEPWDAVGLVSGDPAARVSRIVLAVDAVRDTVDEALASGADLLLVHHPLLLRGVTSVAETDYKGALLARLIRGGCALVASHTNADVVADGTSAALAAALGLERIRPIVPSEAPGTGLGRVGELPEPTTVGRLARAVADALPSTAGGVRVAGDHARRARRVAVCGGAGDSLLGHPEVVASDVYVTADLRHHPASEARERSLAGAGPALIDVSHWASEWLWLEPACRALAERLPDVTIEASDLRTDPWDLAVVR